MSENLGTGRSPSHQLSLPLSSSTHSALTTFISTLSHFFIAPRCSPSISSLLFPLSFLSESTPLSSPIPSRTLILCPAATPAPGGGGPGIGNGIASSIHTSADVDAALRFFSNDQFTFTSNVADVFAHATGDVKSQVKSVLTIGSGILTWGTADLTGLVITLDGYATGTVNTGAAILTKAAIDVTAFTAAKAAYLKALVVNVVQSDVQLAREVKADIVLFVRNAVVLANFTCSDLQARIRDNVATLVSAVNALHLDAKVATCASAAVAIKLALKAYVQSSIASTTVLTVAATKVALDTMLKIVNAWIGNDFGVLSGTAVTLLGMDLKAASDATICKALVAYLLGVNVRFNFVTAYGLDAGLYAKVFSATIGN